MKKSVIRNFCLILVGLSLYGCQFLGLQPSDEELIHKTIANWKEAMETEDVDRLLAIYSEQYETSEGDNKESMRELVKRSFDSGFMETVEIDMGNAKVIVKGNIAKFGPIDFISDTGIWPLELTLQRENSEWLILSSKRLGQ